MVEICTFFVYTTEFIEHTNYLKMNDEWWWHVLIYRITCPAQEYQSFGLVGCGVHPAIQLSTTFLFMLLEKLLHLAANPIHQPCAYLTKRFNSRAEEFIESFVRVAFEMQSLAEVNWGVWLWEKVETAKRDGTFVCIPAWCLCSLWYSAWPQTQLWSHERDTPELHILRMINIDKVMD